MNQVQSLAQADLLRQVLHEVETAQVTVAGDSMSPLLRRGDRIGLRRVDVTQIQPGQVVTFADPLAEDTLLTHRIVAVQQTNGAATALLARGDRSLVFDALVSPEQVIGLVQWRQRDGRILRLDSGAGAWLSAQLGHLAEGERRLTTGVALPPGMPPADLLVEADIQSRRRIAAPWVRGLRLGSRGLSTVLSYLVSWLAGAPSDPALLEL